jgi:hypothetical protein
MFSEVAARARLQAELQPAFDATAGSFAVRGEGDYLPLTPFGTHAERIVAFARRTEEARCIVIAPQLVAPLRDVHDLSRDQASYVLLGMVLRLNLGTFVYGPLDRRFGTRRGVVLKPIRRATNCTGGAAATESTSAAWHRSAGPWT